MAHVSHKLSGALEGALAGGGDPATSPLYVFGPFLKLIVVAGVAQVTFGASVWLAVITVITVSAMYRTVMRWITDGTGGSGLNEEEFGGWAVQVNAGITMIEYTLTFLVSIAALVTFIADRFPAFNQDLLGISLRAIAAAGFSVFVAFAVNRGPKVSAKVFGPATLAILVLLWVLVGATIWQRGFQLPIIDWRAFHPEYIHFTLGGYARILALMTGIEVFANLVAAYDGTAKERSKKAFNSLLIVMGTTAATMVIVGPAILALSNPLDPHVSVFTQTMDQLLPKWLSYAGTIIGILVLLSAAAASLQGVQSLSLGLRYRNYLSAFWGTRNRFEVADKPAWLIAGICVACFFVIGTHEETYLALYAAGVFVLLSLTSWAALKRLARQLRNEFHVRAAFLLAGTLIAAILTTIATGIIFSERFFEGAWGYFVLVPVLYFVFGYYRKNLGVPHSVDDHIGQVISSTASILPQNVFYRSGISFGHVLVPLDGSPTAELTLKIAKRMNRVYGGVISLVTVVEPGADLDKRRVDAESYLESLVNDMREEGYRCNSLVKVGDPSQIITEESKSGLVELIVMSTQGISTLKKLVVSSVTTRVVYETTPPIIIVHPTNDWQSVRIGPRKILVPLDGSATSEQVLPFIHEIADRMRSEVILLMVLDGVEMESQKDTLSTYLETLAKPLRNRHIDVKTMVTGSVPSETILRVCKEQGADLIALVSHGRGGIDRAEHVKVGSVTASILRATDRPVLMISASESQPLVLTSPL